MLKIRTVLFYLIATLSFAQPLQLPTIINGTGTYSTNSFVANKPFIVSITNEDNLELYLYDKVANTNIAIINGGELLEFTGEFFIYIYSQNPVAKWTLSIIYESGLYERPQSNPKTDLYNCIDFATPAEAQSFFIAQGGPEYDPNNLDGNGNGIACEKGSDDADSDTMGLCPPGKHWVRPYTRKDGVHVRGHCRLD